MAVNIPIRDANYKNWLQQLSQIATDRQAELMLSNDQLAEIQAVAAEFTQDFEAAFAAKQALHGLIATKDDSRARADEVMRTYLQMIANNPAVGISLKGEMSIRPTRAPSSPVRTPAQLTWTGQSNGLTTLRWHPNGNSRSVTYIVESKTAGSAVWQLEAATSKTRISFGGHRAGDQVMYRVTATRGGRTSSPTAPVVAYPGRTTESLHRRDAA